MGLLNKQKQSAGGVLQKSFIKNFSKLKGEHFLLQSSSLRSLYTTPLGECFSYSNPAGNYLSKVNNKNTTARCEVCSKLTIKTPERRQ